ncbi:aldo/keto reductase [Picrophilus oshimae]|uniref:Hypothetical aldo/keto reductase n=1 Tax=Picrophilus torridus (strain ATCC 700027 / DSM 9790 / JCM 10055 / NBRC 100828 / KAW 2/3) TaxID=1122961 RepID=Q6L0N6_PICTO|nr:aldo/keto reductase [Picrophilus oshimae]AAT43466.1 hypothetical aldo/keto reductase [Picrophilus oshimae DSM 9789]
MRIGDKNLPSIGFGTYRLGGSSTPVYENDEYDVNIIKYALSRGLSVIDTAEYYGNGHTEELVSKAIKDFNRNNIYIISKVWHNHLHYEDVIKSLKNSLRRLNTNYIDLYLIHWPNKSIPLNETLSAMEYLKDSGYIRDIGVSNFNESLLDEALSSMKKYEIVANEIEYNLNNASVVENDVIKYCIKNRISVIAYSPLNRGYLNRSIDSIAKKNNMSNVQLTLAYLKRLSLPIPMSRNIKHIDEIASAMKIDLSDDVYNEVRNSIL